MRTAITWRCVNVDELPDALRAPLRACHAALTREPPLRGEDAVRATVRKLSNVEADEIAASVVRLFGAAVQAAARVAAAGARRAPVERQRRRRARQAAEDGAADDRAVRRRGVKLHSSLNSIVSQRVVSS